MTSSRNAAIALALWCAVSALANYTGLTEMQEGYYHAENGSLEASLVVDRVTDEGFHVVIYNAKSLAKKCMMDGDVVYRKGSKFDAHLDWTAPDGLVCHYKVGTVGTGLSLVTLKSDQVPCNLVCDKTMFPTERAFKYQYPGCSARQITARREDFKKLYDGKKYGEAYEVLNYTYDHCLGYVDPDGEAWLYSDLALVALKKGDAKKCLEVLDEYEGVRVPPNGKVAKALELNKELCKGGGKG